MDHDQVAAGGDEVLNLADLGCGAVVAGNDGGLCASIVQDFLQGGHNACPICILQRLDGDADFLAAQNRKVCLSIEFRACLNTFGTLSAVVSCSCLGFVSGCLGLSCCFGFSRLAAACAAASCKHTKYQCSCTHQCENTFFHFSFSFQIRTFLP